MFFSQNYLGLRRTIANRVKKTSRGPNKVSLPRAISKLGFASRSQALQVIQGGRVIVNGRVERNPHRWVNLLADTIKVDNELLTKQPFRYIILNKPRGLVTSKADERGRATVFDILEEEGEGLAPVGRLDKDTTGLLLFTNDHQLANLLISPESGVEKTYLATVDRDVDQKDLQRCADGMEIEGRGKVIRTKPAVVKLKGQRLAEITLTEGRNRQVRRMFEALGYQVVDLKRTSIGPLELGDLREGESRDLSHAEIEQLRSAVARGDLHTTRSRSNAME
jgi:23S rRNA pseudouridine2605 synthase